jgi:hypothetical protein
MQPRRVAPTHAIEARSIVIVAATPPRQQESSCFGLQGNMDARSASLA